MNCFLLFFFWGGGGFFHIRLAIVRDVLTFRVSVFSKDSRTAISKAYDFLEQVKGPMKLMQWVKLAHSFLQSVSNLFHFIILSLLI